MNLSIPLRHTFAVLCCLCGLSGCHPESEQTDYEDVARIEPDPTLAPPVNSPKLCDELVDSVGPRAALQICLDQAKSGNTAAQMRLGMIHATGALGEENWEQGMHWLLLAAESGHSQAQYEVAQSYLLGRGVNQNPTEAFQWLNKAVKSNHVGAQALLGVCYLKGQGTLRNIPQALQWFTLSAKQNDPVAQYYLGQIHLEGSGVEQNAFLAEKHLNASAEQNFTPAQLALAKLYQEGKVLARNDFKAMHWYGKAAEQDDPQGLHAVGMSYIAGAMGQPKNIEHGATYLKKAADKGYYPAQYAMATLYLEGHPVLQDKHTAIEFLRLAALGGLADAQIKLAKVLIDFSLPQYDKVAFYWADKAASSNNLQAKYLLGSFYLDGIGTPIDYVKAFQIFSDLAQKDDPLSEFKLGQMYYYGQGVDKNISIAKKWFLKAARLGVSDAKNWVAILYRGGIERNEYQVDSLEEEEFKEWVNLTADNREPEGLYLKGAGYIYGRDDFGINFDEGIRLITDAAEMQFVPAQRELGMIYEEGLFGMHDSLKAYEWYLKAAKQGDGYSQYRLANMYYIGIGVPRDYVQSYAWAHLAAISGKEDASNLRDEVSNLLDVKQLSVAQKLSDEYFDAHKKGNQVFAMPEQVSIPEQFSMPEQASIQEQVLIE